MTRAGTRGEGRPLNRQIPVQEDQNISESTAIGGIEEYRPSERWGHRSIEANLGVIRGHVSWHLEDQRSPRFGEQEEGGEAWAAFSGRLLANRKIPRTSGAQMVVGENRRARGKTQP